MKQWLVAALLALIVSIGGSGAVFAGSDVVVVEAAWARASIGTSRPGVAYLTMSNTGDEEATLIGIETPISARPEVHRTTTSDQGISTMSPAGDLTIGAGETVALEPGGLHVMLMMLRQKMIEGETFPLTLSFSDGKEVTIEVPILAIGARGPNG